ncbi:MAG: hypothetical protein ABEJ65_03275, partial [bacterium]
MKKWVQYFKQRRWLSGGILFFVAVVFIGFVYVSSENQLTLSGEATARDPFNGELLLRSARHHYRFVRKRISSQGITPTIKKRIETALRHYRRIQAVEDWQLNRRDYFYNAYLYYYLDNYFRKRDIGTGYMERAQDMALKSHEMGYRSAELVT